MTGDRYGKSPLHIGLLEKSINRLATTKRDE